MNFELLAKHIKSLKRSRPAILKKSQEKKIKPVKHRPKTFILVEEFLLFRDARVRKMLDLKIYFELPIELMFERRAKRAMSKKFYEYDMRVAIPEYLKHGVIQRKYADFTLDARLSNRALRQKVYTIIKLNFEQNLQRSPI